MKPIDPIRIMKGMFLFVQEGGNEVRDLYAFEPYHYGPCSFDLYRDLESLEAVGLVKREPVPGLGWSYLVPTLKGLEEARRISDNAPQQLVTAMKDRKSFVTSLSFLQLLREVYRRYPTFATRSIVSFAR